MKKSVIGKLFTHAVPVLMFPLLRTWQLFPKLQTHVSPNGAFFSFFAIWAVLFLALRPLGYFRWYTDPAPDSPPRGTSLKLGLYLLAGFLLGVALSWTITTAWHLLHPVATTGFAEKVLSIVESTLVAGGGFAGIALSGWTGLWNREAPQVPALAKS